MNDELTTDVSARSLEERLRQLASGMEIGFDIKELRSVCLEAARALSERPEPSDRPDPLDHDPPAASVFYRNWKGQLRYRSIRPIRMWYGRTHHHPQGQWFIYAFDVEKGEVRDFALSGFECPGPLSPPRIGPGTPPLAMSIACQDAFHSECASKAERQYSQPDPDGDERCGCPCHATGS